MAFIRTAPLLLLTTTLCATEYAPWFPPLFEVQAEAAYLYTHANRVQTPLGTFHEPTRNSSLHGSLGVTPLPYWNLEGEIYLTRTSNISFTYEAAWLTLRYAWLDDIAGDCLTLVTGATFSFPGSRFLHQFSLPYHGHFNTEIHTSLGKEWSCGPEWKMRLWGLAGVGIAERGSPWVHAIAAASYRISRCTALTLFSETLLGLGSHNILPHTRFRGYANIAHRSLSICSSLDYELPYLATLAVAGWYMPYTHNFIDHPWGIAASLLIPFGLF